jgi:hypothetical protein
VAADHDQLAGPLSRLADDLGGSDSLDHNRLDRDGRIGCNQARDLLFGRLAEVFGRIEPDPEIAVVNRRLDDVEQQELSLVVAGQLVG